jgi:seryl-tRNA synthetase
LLNLNFIREHADIVRKAAADKNVSLDLDALLQLDGEVREAKTRVDTLRAQRNEVSSRFKDAAPEQKKELGAQSKLIASEIASTEELLKGREAELSGLLLRIPNIPWEGAPVGPDENSNVVIRQEGELPSFDFEPLDHVALIEKNDWADLARITQVSGSRTYCLKGRLALLEQVLMVWAMERLSASGFTLMTVPALARPQAFVGTGHFPGHEEEAYHLPADDLYLAGTGRSRSPACTAAKFSTPPSSRSSTPATRPASGARRAAPAAMCAVSCASTNSSRSSNM